MATELFRSEATVNNHSEKLCQLRALGSLTNDFQERYSTQLEKDGSELDLNTQAQIDLNATITSMWKGKRFRTVPPWGAPREIWLSALSEIDGACNAFYIAILQLCILIRQLSRSPALWHVSLGAPVSGCLGLRLIHILDAFGKAFFAGIWTQIAPGIDSHCFGFVKHRRREEAILVIKLACWRLVALGHSWLAAFYDMTNAFPSIDQDLVAQTLISSADQWDLPLLLQRLFEAVLVIQDATAGEQWWRIGSGTLQGDTLAPDEFMLPFSELVDGIISATRSELDHQTLDCYLPGTTEPIDISNVLFADDVARVGVCTCGLDAITRSNEWDDEMLAQLKPALLQQNLSKKQTMIRCSGRHSKEYMTQLIHEGGPAAIGGKVGTEAKHLGAWHSSYFNTKVELNARQAAVSINWKAFGRWWVSSAPLTLRLLLFKCLIVSALLLALEPQTLSTSDLQVLEKTQIKYARVLLKGKAQGCSNNSVRRQLQLCTVESMLQLRRLNWLKSLAKDPDHHVVIWAALIGQSKAETYPQLDDSYRPLSSANPWLQQWWHDLCTLAEYDRIFKQRLESQGLFAIFDEHFQITNTRKVLSFVVSHVGEQSHAGEQSSIPAGEQIEARQMFACTVEGCHFDFETLQAMVLHRRIVHLIANPFREAVITNQCPWCQRTYADTEHAKAHTRIRQRSGSCPTRSGGRFVDTTLKQPHSLRCPFCDHIPKTLQAYNSHVVAHQVFDSAQIHM
jgi:hypothetical protein